MLRMLNWIFDFFFTGLFSNPKKMEVRPPLFVGIVGGIIGLLWSGSLWIALFSFGFCFLSFLFMGLHLVPIGHKALVVWMGMQQLDRYTEAGWKWYWPAPFGGWLPVDCQNKNLDLNFEDDEKEVLTKDRVPAKFKLSIAYNRGPDRSIDPFDEHGRPIPKNIRAIAEALFDNVITQDAEEQLGQEAEDQLRIAVAGISSDTLHTRKEELTDIVQEGKKAAQEKEAARKAAKGKNKKNPPAPETKSSPENPEEIDSSAPKDADTALKKGIREDVKKFGIHVQSIQITSIRLPEGIEEDRVTVQREKAQREAERIEREGNIKAIDDYVARGMSAKEAAIVHQTERKKVTRTVQTFEGLDLEGFGRGIGLAIAAATAGKTGTGESPRRRRRPRSKTKPAAPSRPQA